MLKLKLHNIISNYALSVVNQCYVYQNNLMNTHAGCTPIILKKYIKVFSLLRLHSFLFSFFLVSSSISWFLSYVVLF
jgi:hypothetical protein